MLLEQMHSLEINYQNVGNELQLTNTVTGKVIFGELIHDLLLITLVQIFDIAYRGGNHVEEALARVRNIGGDVSSVKRRRPKAHLWGVKTPMVLELDGRYRSKNS